MSEPSAESVAPLVEHFFRHESGRLVSVLTRIFGWRNFDLVEDVVQATLLDALQSWRVRGVPDNPSAWVHAIAKNKILDALRRERIGSRILEHRSLQKLNSAERIDELFLDSEIEDSELRMIFACCHPRLSRENQIALTLKSLCGFGLSEIARALLASEEAIKKRLQRATRELMEEGIALDPPAPAELAERLESVHRVLYLLFNEGYSATEGEEAIRIDLCEEAARLCHLLCSQAPFNAPSSHALMALMLFHGSRLEARRDGRGCILLMEDQDRTKWDQNLLKRAKVHLDLSAEGSALSHYHLEAGIAFQHCVARSFEETDWRAILTLYDALLQIHSSPIYLLNRAIALAQVEGPRAGIIALEAVRRDSALQNYHLLDSTLGELHRRAGDLAQARHHFGRARQKASSSHERELIDRRLATCAE